MNDTEPKETPVLPSLASDLIEAALRDLEEVEKDEKYEIEMSHWHVPKPVSAGLKPTFHCQVCLAGAVMAKTLDTPLTDFAYPYHFGRENERKLIALDCFRMGNITGGLFSLGTNQGAIAALPEYHPITHYRYDRERFKKDMRSLAEKLRRAGL